MERRQTGAKLEGVEALKKYIKEQASRRVEAFIGQLNAIGMQTVTKIRTGEVSNWDDHTHNLRSSIGYLVLHDGKIVGSNFALSSGKGAEGLTAGKQYAQELAEQYPSGYVLIIVAGMNYAAYVEDVESKTVLAGGELYAKKALETILKKFNKI